MLQGKGIWAYRRNELEQAIDMAPRMGATHIIYKVGQGSSYYPGMAQVAEKIKAAGLVPFAWMWLLLDEPRSEAQVVVHAFRDGFAGFVFDTEADRCRNRFDQARQLGQYIQVADIDQTNLYNCSFPNISHHRDLPYDQMNEFCKGGLMPMSYGTFFAPGSSVTPERQAQRVIDEWTYGHYAYWARRWGYRPPLYPVLGPYHDEHGNVRMRPDEFQVWLDRLADHQPSFFSVFTAAVIGDELLPLIKAMPLGEPPEAPVWLGMQVEVVSPDVGYLNIRPGPSTAQAPIARVSHGAYLEVLEPEDVAISKVGRDGQWINIRTPDGVDGYAAAWYLTLVEVEEPEEPEEPEEEIPPVETQVRVEVVSPQVGYLNVRPIPSTARPAITRVDDGAVLESLEAEMDTLSKVGQRSQWLHVRTPDNIEGYVAAWYLRFYEEEGYDPDKPVALVVVHSATGLNVRQAPGDSPVIWRVGDRTVLEVIEDPDQVGDKIGKDRWVHVRTPSLHQGYVNGAYIRAKQTHDRRMPVKESDVPAGSCPWIFGIHAAGGSTAANFRFLFQGKGKQGWVLFTEAIGADPHHGGGQDYSAWSDKGYGVIVRLNHGYEPAGTLPVRAKYSDFARSCAEYVRNSKGCHVWVIGNEQNNVREHPGGAAHPIEHITPSLYAEAFNVARQRIKAVQPEAIVVAGAVDPYNTYPWEKAGGLRYRPLQYFEEMLSYINDLDGIALHTYTHWMDVDLITAKTVFNDPFLQPGTPKEHYYDFQAYRSFAEAVPAKWRDRPLYITECNHWVATDHRPQNSAEEGNVGWLNADRGWIQAAYAEINRWNNQPFAQQIHCCLMYRWTGDAWAIENLDKIHQDFKRALNHDYRWRR